MFRERQGKLRSFTNTSNSLTHKIHLKPLNEISVLGIVIVYYAIIRYYQLYIKYENITLI